MPQNKQSSTFEIYRKYPLPEKKESKRKEKRFNLCKGKTFAPSQDRLVNGCARGRNVYISYHSSKNLQHKRKRNSPHLGKHKKREKVLTFFLQSIFCSLHATFVSPLGYFSKQ